ncbi:spatacsin isoform X1 [Centrocercus urophasianus]|uniref:spatacsin isoform X1 n=2 Tax=Centrocercus urophasianus TaxID=9002 RepID=UPI001C653085|nr:spatacsin isoform X1 [Centrocercus urophasianus]
MAGARRELGVLLAARPGRERDAVQGAVRARLSAGQDALGSLSLRDGIYLESLGPGGGGRARSSVLPGAWADFVWESTAEYDPQADKTKILAVSESHDLFVYEFTREEGKCSPDPLHSCEEGALKKLLETNSISLSSILSLRILSFKDNRCILLLNSFIVMHITFPGERSSLEMCDCFTLDLPPPVLERITDINFCRGILFFLDSSGWIYVFDSFDGANLAHIDVLLCLGGVQEGDRSSAVTSPLAAVKVSYDLSVAVVISASNSACSVDLNMYFRQFPGHLICKRDPESLPLKPPEGVDEDDLASSDYSMELLSSPFRTDRSWKAHLSSLRSTIRKRGSRSPHLLCDMNLPWYQYFTHLEDHDPLIYETHEEALAVAPKAFPRVLPNPSQSAGTKLSDAGRRWKQILPVQLSHRVVKLECKCVTGAKALFVILADDKALTLALWDFESQDVTHHQFSKNSVYVDCNEDVPLCLLLTERGLSLILFGLTREEFLNRLMIYGSAGVVDAVCHLNAWGRCSIPVHALEAGLENRQLDTVDLFLKSKESLFNLSALRSEAQQSADGASCSFLKNLQELRPALNLLCSAIRENDMEPQSKHFSEQLLNLTLTFLSKQLEEIFVHTEEPDGHLQKAAEILSDYIIELRTFLKNYPRSQVNATDVESDSDEDLPAIEESQVWEKLTPEEVIAEAILSNKMPEAQTFFRMRQHPAQSLQELIRMGLDLVYGRLLKGNTREASALLKNMGFDVKRQLRKICFYTADGRVRDLLVKVLQEENYFSEKEKKMIDFVHQVESLHSESFQENKEMQSLSSVKNWRQEQDSAKHLAALESLLDHDGRQVPSREVRVMLNWAQWWDELLQDLILLPRKQGQGLATCNPEALWMHLTARHDWLSIASWIEEFEPSRSSCAQSKWPPLTAAIVDQKTLCSGYMRNDVLNELARKGIFVLSELEDFELLLQRLVSLGGVLQNPHPVPKHSAASGLDFHARFVLHCLEHNLQYMLYTYLDYYSLTPSNCPILDDKELHEAHPWFEFLVRCRGVASNPRDPKMIFQASLANAQILIPSNQASVSSVLLEGRTLLALATTMYAPGGIDQVLQNEDTEKPLKKVDPQLLKMALSPYPKLRAALFPPCTSHGILPPDISLYHLVQSLVPFDPSKLFGWQSTNTLAVSDASSDLPHFSCPELVNKYAVMERLDFLYYLRHGRPSFAFGTFLVQQLVKSKSPKQLVQQAGNEAFLLGLSFFNTPSVAAACVCFLELLGLSSLKLRVDIKVANMIFSYKTRNEESQHSQIRESLVEQLMRLADGEKAATDEVLKSLEEAFWDSIEHQGIKRTSSDSRQQWSLVMQFCKLHTTKLSTSYLKECAESNDWLQFIIQAQLYGYKPDEVTSVLEGFAPVLQHHLVLALEKSPFLRGAAGGPGGSAGGRRADGLFQILLRCQQSPGASCHLLAEGLREHAPILSVLAACFPEADIIHCLCVWIITSVDSVTRSEATKHVQSSVENHKWDLHDLSLIWKVFLRKQKCQTLIRGFQLFLKDSPLLHILEMYHLCMDCKKYNEAKTKLDEFQKLLTNLKTAEGPAASQVPVQWLESQALFLLELMLQQCRTEYELGKLLQLLAATDNLLLDGLYVKKLYALSEILKGSSVPVNPSMLTRFSPETFQNECRSILEQLQEKGLFSLARKVAELAELPADSVVTREVLRDLQLLRDAGEWDQEQIRMKFWKKCNDSFMKNCISSKAASDFFLNQADVVFESSVPEKINSIAERHLLLTLAGHWLAKDASVALDKLEEIEKQIWTCRITQQTLSAAEGSGRSRRSSSCAAANGDFTFDNLAEEFSFSKLPALNAPSCLNVEGLEFGEHQQTLADDEEEALRFLLGCLLDEGSVHEASRVCRYFHFYSRDVSLVLHCRALASGEADLDKVHADIQALVAAEKTQESSASQQSRVPSTSSSEDWTHIADPSLDDQIVLSLKALTEECVHGRNYCRQVLCLYELSQELNCSYSEMSALDPEKVLRAILSSQQAERCRRAQAFITTQGLQPETVAELVAKEVVQELLASSEGKGQKQVSNPAAESQAFLQLAKLCQDHTLVGMKLLEKISSVPRGELSCITELLILAHHCFSLTCHMEGITRVLQAARLLTDEHLAPNDEYGLMVRLLTGIGRYNEMTYIFELLHEKHYFEVLMRKKLDPSGTLKTALLDYIKRCRPGDSEKHNMIALCFSMCREIGENHEAAACIQLKLIESQPWEESLQDVANLKKLLMKALTLFIDAAESYSKDSCVRQALRCRRLTKLITLQLHFLSAGQSTMLINRNRQNLMECIVSLPRFYQAAVVAEAYEFVPDWAEVLYQQVITKGDFSYLEEFKQQRLLKPALFEEIAKKCKQHPPTDAALRNLKKLLAYCEDISTYYRLAYENKFYDVVNVLLKDAQTGCCLNDMLSN